MVILTQQHDLLVGLTIYFNITAINHTNFAYENHVTHVPYNIKGKINTVGKYVSYLMSIGH